MVTGKKPFMDSSRGTDRVAKKLWKDDAENGIVESHPMLEGPASRQDDSHRK